MKKLIFFIVLSLVSAGCKGNGEKVQPMQENGQEVRDTMRVARQTEQEAKNDEQLPKSALRVDSHDQMAVYVNEEKAPDEDDLAGVYSVWLVNERTGSVRKLCQTNPMAEAQWSKMEAQESDAVDVPIDQIAIASKAYLAPKGRVIVEGCPDARNVWTYIIDPDKNTAKQFPTTEGVGFVDWEKEEIILASYGYDIEMGRYTYTRAYSVDGRFLRVASEKEEE